MTVRATIESTDFIPISNSNLYIFIFFTRDNSGRAINIEDFGTKTALCRKYGVESMSFEHWHERHFKGRQCEVKTGRWRRNKFVRFTQQAVEQNLDLVC